jgi:hypothetical protein
MLGIFGFRGKGVSHTYILTTESVLLTLKAYNIETKKRYNYVMERISKFWIFLGLGVQGWVVHVI